MTRFFIVLLINVVSRCAQLALIGWLMHFFRIKKSQYALRCKIFVKKYKIHIMCRVLQAGKWNFERGQTRSKMTFSRLKMIIFGHFTRFLVSFKIGEHSKINLTYLILTISFSVRRPFLIKKQCSANFPDQTWRLADMFLSLFESQWTTACYYELCY